MFWLVHPGNYSASPRHLPDKALGMKVPADVYARSPRVYRGLEELTYPFHDQTIMVTGCGRISSAAGR